MKKRKVLGPGFIMTDEKEDQSNNKDTFLVFSILGGWIVWVVIYLLYLRPLVCHFFFNLLGLNAFPAIIHLIPILLIPAFLVIFINYVVKLCQAYLTKFKSQK